MSLLLFFIYFLYLRAGKAKPPNSGFIMKPLKKIILNVVALTAICAVLLLLLQAWLSHYTRHNDAIRVPAVTGMSVARANEVLTQAGLRFEVVDSIYRKGIEPGTVLEQKPASQAKVKPGRIIFLVVNSEENVSVPVPYVKDYSQRQAVATLEGMGFVIERITFVPSEYKNLVIDITYKGESVQPGATLPKGSAFSLVVGQGSTDESILIPDFTGLPLDSAFLTAHNNNVNIGEITYDVQPANEAETALYRVQSQDPVAGSEHAIGEHIHIWMAIPSLHAE